MSDDSIARVHYFERQFLRTTDFVAEQEYHVAMRRRHNIAHHIWGVVAGLRLEVDTANELFVGPGMAVDGYGRELILQEKQPLSRESFVDKDTDVLGVWLIYDRTSSDRAPVGYAGCTHTSSGLGSEYRWQEQPRVRVDVIDASQPNMREPATVPPGDWAFNPNRVPPDDPEREWPVFLGQIRRAPDPSQPGNYRYSVIQADYNQPYAGLIGEAIVAPSGRARLQIGAEDPRDPRRFAVFIEDQAAPGSLKPFPSLDIGQDGMISLRGQLTAYGDLTMAGGGIEFGVGSGYTAQARPWQIYQQVEKTSVISMAQTPSSEAQEVTHQLRIEMAHGTRGLNQVVVGAWSPDDKVFKPCLTVADNCVVTVHGNLVVQGVLTEMQTRPKPQITEQTRALALSTTLSTISQKLLTLGDAEQIVLSLLRMPQGRQQIADILDKNPQLQQPLFEKLVDHTSRQDAVARALLVNVTALQAVLQALANDAAGQAAITAIVQTNAAVRTAVIKGLLENNEGREAVAQAVLDSGDALKAVLGAVANDAAGRAAITAIVQTNAAARTAVIKGLLENNEGRVAAAQGLLVNDAALQAVLQALANDAVGQAAITAIVQKQGAIQSAVIAALLRSDAGRTIVAGALLANNDAFNAVVQSLVSDVRVGRPALINALLASAEALPEVVSSLIATEEGQAVIVDNLRKHNTALRVILQSLVKDSTTHAPIIDVSLNDDVVRKKVIDELRNKDSWRVEVSDQLIANEAGRQTLVSRLVRDENTSRLNDVINRILDTAGPRAVGQSLAAKDQRITSLAQVLMTEFPDVAARLRERLSPTP